MRAFPAAALLVAGPALAADLSGGNAAQGYRIAPMAGGTGIALSEHVVMGTDGGTHAFTPTLRLRIQDVQLGGALPFASYRVPGGRDADLGNVRLWGQIDLPFGPLDHALGIAAHFGVGESAYSWVNAGDQLWPGAGLDAYWEGRVGGDVTTWMFRGAFGVHGAARYDPFPDRYLRLQVAAGADYAVMDRVGLVGEMSVQYWDLSPWEISGLVRVDVIEGLRLRAGLVAPLAVWFGWAPSDQPGGLRETTLVLDASAAF